MAKSDISCLNSENNIECNEFITIFVDSLRRIADYDRHFHSSEYLESQRQFNNQSLFRISARLSSLRNRSTKSSNISNKDIGIILERYCFFPECSTQNLSQQQIAIFDLILKELCDANLSKKSSIISDVINPTKNHEISPITGQSTNNEINDDITTSTSSLSLAQSNQKNSSKETPKTLNKTDLNSDFKKFKFTFNSAAFVIMVLAYRFYDKGQDFAMAKMLCKSIIQCYSSGLASGQIFNLIVEKAIFLFALSSEHLGDLDRERIFLQQLLSFSTYRKQYAHQAILINTLLRSYILDNSFDLANKFAAKVDFPVECHSFQSARYQFYLGKICAISSNYSKALQHFNEASRKSSTTHPWIPFVSLVSKNLLIVTLLLGNLPEKTLITKSYLKDYKELTRSVIQGKLLRFHQEVSLKRHIFEQDNTLSLILRLPNNVLKMALKLVAKSYSHISLDDVAKRLELDDSSNIHYILQNAIMNNVIQGSIDDNNILVTQPGPKSYGTCRAANSLQERAQFCEKLLKKCQKAIRHVQDPKIGDDDEFLDLSDGQLDFDLFNGPNNNNNFSDMTDEF